jgi:hypothetical protein
VVTVPSLEPVPLSIRTDPEHGGRWTSLSGAGREWLWHRDEPRRKHVVPGDAFADAGGLEECVPTVRGNPDHGDAWSRAWTATGDDEFRITCPDFELTRRIDMRTGSVVADYRLVAEPGYRFLWAGHALLDLTPDAHLHIDQGTTTRVFPESTGAEWIEGHWPTAAGHNLDTLGPDDGSAIGAVIETNTAVVDDGPDRLQLSLQVTGQPSSIALWRNLGGFPADDPYRSIGVEPMLGRVFDLAHADSDGDCAVTPSSGEVRWRLTITAYHLKE